MIEKLRKKIKHYISPDDRFIHEFDKAHPDESSPLKQREIEKNARIAHLRDNANQNSGNSATTTHEIWSDF